MKFILSVLITSLLTLSAQASEQNLGWVCVVDDRDVDAIAELNIPDYLSGVGVLIAPGEQCGLPHVMIYKDSCNLGGHTLNIGLVESQSVLTSKDGVQFVLLCEKNRIVNPQHGGDSPSHGGGH